MRMLAEGLRHLTTGLLLLLVAGCGTTATQESHPLLAQSSDGNIAKVYFLRPDPGFVGVMGNAFKISLSGQELLTLAKGEYTLVYLRPYSGDVEVESSTVVNRGGLNTQVTVQESQQFIFDESKTYFITFREIRRGVMQGSSYRPYGITKDAARSLASELEPVGRAATSPL